MLVCTLLARGGGKKKCMVCMSVKMFTALDGSLEHLKNSEF